MLTQQCNLTHRRTAVDQTDYNARARVLDHGGICQYDLLIYVQDPVPVGLYRATTKATHSLPMGYTHSEDWSQQAL